MAELDIPGFSSDSVLIDLTGDDSDTCSHRADCVVVSVEPYIKQEPMDEDICNAFKAPRNEEKHIKDQINSTSHSSDALKASRDDEEQIKDQINVTPDSSDALRASRDDEEQIKDKINPTSDNSDTLKTPTYEEQQIKDNISVTFDNSNENTRLPPEIADGQAGIGSGQALTSFTEDQVIAADKVADIVTLQQHEGEDGLVNQGDMDLADMEALMLYNQNKAKIADQHEEGLANAGITHTASGSNFDGQPWYSAQDAPQDIDPVFENDLSIAAFERRKEEYEEKKSLGLATQVDDIRFAAEEAAEESRLRDYERSQTELGDITYEYKLPPGYAEEDSLFIPESSPLAESHVRMRAPPKPKNRINKQEMWEAMSAGIDTGYTKGGKPKRKATVNTGGPKPKKPRVTKATAAKRPRTRAPVLSNVGSLGRTNIVQAAQANASRPDMPTFTARDKNKALKELIASIPSANGGLHRSDKKAIMEATKKFRGKGAVRSDGQGAWRHRDMESSLYNHQLLGVAFLRDRENSTTKPQGGLVCDEMGFGKTIQMIANILDGKPDENSQYKTTLIVAPSTLLTQWMSEMDKHVKDNRLGRILRYHSGARLLSNDILADLSSYDIILTTYSEVQRSYPVAEPPKHLSSEAKKNEWWANFYKENVGPLHRLKFHRIVLDEAHVIKNHTSKTSMAVCALTGVYKWCITGTPIMNYIEELYPYFRFLRVPHTGDYSTFVHNYCNNRTGREPVNMERIHNILRAIMLRRTHVDTMFNAPVVKLPGITHTTHIVEFNEVERAIYTMVKTRYIYEINRYSRSGALTANYRNILAMMLRLRMLCSHVLLCQDVLKRMFTAGDVEALWRLTAREVQASGDENQKNMIAALRKMLQTKDSTVITLQTKVTEEPAKATAREEVETSDNTGQGFALSFKFRKFLRSLSESKTWTELHIRSTCGKCRLPPDDPICTSCFHVYCKECITSMDYERQGRGDAKCACLECGALFEGTSPCSGLKELGFNSEEVRQKIGKAKRRSQRSSTGPGNTDNNNNGNQASNAGDESDEEDPDWIDLMGSTILPSAKLAATKAAILNWQQTARGEKIIIYTQFLGLCRILDKVCSAEGWGHVLFNGKMSLEAREKAIDRFTYDPQIFIMICSLKAGGVGLNLSMASKVIILDLWFNSSIEAQAYCRAFRIGQQRKVEVLRFVVKDTIDEDLIKMQDHKDIEVTGAIGPESHGKRATIHELLELFGQVREEGQNEFILVEDENQEDDDDPTVPVGDRLPPRPF